MVYLFSLHRQRGDHLSYAELRSAVTDLPFFHAQGTAGFICDIPQRRVWMELTVEQDGSITVHVPHAVFEQNSRMINDLCRSLATQLRAVIYDHQLERDLEPGEPMSIVHLPDTAAMPGPVKSALTSPLGSLLTVLLTAVLLTLLAFVLLLAVNIGSVALRR